MVNGTGPAATLFDATNRRLHTIHENILECNEVGQTDPKVKRRTVVRAWSKLTSCCAIFALGLTIGAQPLCAADSKMHHIAIQVSDNDPAKMNLALNNAANVAQAYSAK
jgi:hypothetical protein